jgi:TolB-like protein/DNA-binding winged helix-turn-helix (wHTH) protein/rhodanese-related sulfurtransferase
MATDPPLAPAELAAVSYRFGRFVLEPDRRLLTAEAATVALSSRGLDILLLLIEHRDRVVGKNEILTKVWQGMLVEENNLAVQISGLRRALGDGEDGRSFITTVPGRGYRFVGAVSEQKTPETSVPALSPVLPLPEPPALPPPAPPLPTSLVARHWIVPAVAAGLLLILGVIWGVTRFGPWADTPAPRMSVVVLPFRNLGADRGQDYLADAISDDLTTDLSHLPGSTVIARESADTYKGRAVAAQSIGRALKVRYLLEGSLRGEGATLHINAQLIDAPSGAHLWASAFDVPRGGLDGAREEIVRHLASVLDFTLVQIESARSLHERPRNPDAVDLYLRARSQLDRDDSLAGLAAAQALLEQAITVGPDFSDAQAQLALVLLRKINGYDDPDEWRDHARAAAMIARALAVAPRNPRAITARGELAREDARCDTARPSFSLALSLDPDQTQARVGLAECDHDLGRMQDMIDDLKQVIRIDPAAPNIAPRQNRIGLGYLMLGNLAEATAWFERARAAIADPAAAPASLSWQEWNRLYLIAAAWESGDHARATSLYTDYARQSPHRTVWQLGAYDTHAMAVLPGRVTFFKALAAAGMPLYADDNLPGSATATAGGDFDPAPPEIQGAARIDTAGLRTLLDGHAPVRVLDVGRGTAAIPGAILVWPDGVWGDPDQMLEQAAAAGAPPASPATEQAIVVMGDGPCGWSSTAAALHLVAKGYHHVLWYRGGEEAWVKAGNPTEDRRIQ